MSRQHVQFTLDLTLAAPVLSHKSGAQRFGYDMSMLRDTNDTVVFLGSHIRGHLLHILKAFHEQLQKAQQPTTDLEKVIAYFGQESQQKSQQASYAPKRAAFNFSYYWSFKQPLTASDTAPRFRIGIDPDTGTTVKGNVQVIETVFANGANELALTGNITAQLSADEAKNCHLWLSKASHYLPAIGALKGTGFGRITAAQCAYQTISPQQQTIDWENSGRMGLQLTFDRPFCIAKPHLPDSNRFVSEDFIPGSAIIGAIAEQYSQIKDQAWFNKIQIRHAYATSADTKLRTAVLPLSLAYYDDTWVDLALAPDPEKVYLLRQNGGYCAPTLQADWKDHDYTRAKQKLGHAATRHQRHLVVRTAIDATTQQAKDQALFSLECIAPQDDVWLTEINLNRLNAAEKTAAMTAFKHILAYPLRGIGKTKASATLTVMPKALPDTNPVKPLNDHRYIITLQTPARLFAEPEKLKATGDADTLKQSYAQYWQTQSKQKLSLSHYFAQQTRVGGQFYWQYYRKKSAYQPEWLTKAGSVFVLKANPGFNLEDINALLDEWQQFGLPCAADRSTDTWQSNPYRNQNGYAEIRVNDAIHSDLADYTQGEWL